MSLMRFTASLAPTGPALDGADPSVRPRSLVSARKNPDRRGSDRHAPPQVFLGARAGAAVVEAIQAAERRASAADTAGGGGASTARAASA